MNSPGCFCTCCRCSGTGRRSPGLCTSQPAGGCTRAGTSGTRNACGARPDRASAERRRTTRPGAGGPSAGRRRSYREWGSLERKPRTSRGRKRTRRTRTRRKPRKHCCMSCGRTAEKRKGRLEIRANWSVPRGIWSEICIVLKTDCSTGNNEAIETQQQRESREIGISTDMLSYNPTGWASSR